MSIAMHMSDGLINAPLAVVCWVVAAILLGYATYRARADLDDRTAPMAGLVAAFVFAVQMINFPILPGASGHLLGGALVAILVGPWVGSICIAIVLAVQALLFADGGLSALGANIINMAFISTFVGYGIAVAMRRLAQRGTGGLAVTAFVAALVATLAASLGFVGRVRDRWRRWGKPRHGVHADGRAARADRDRRGHHHRADRRRRGRGTTGPGLPAAPGATGHRAAWRRTGRRERVVTESPSTHRSGGRVAVFLIVFLAVSLVIAGAISYLASPDPDGLDTVTLSGCEVTETEAGEQLSGECIAQNAQDSPVAGSPFADYGVGGDGALVGLAGIVGVLVTLALAGGLFWLLRRRSGPGRT